MADVLALLSYYRFEFGERTPPRTISDWLEKYPANWVRLAIVEALYQGRYKAVSVTQILAAWQRRDQPYPHFNYEFESLVCRHVQMPIKETQTVRNADADADADADDDASRETEPPDSESMEVEAPVDASVDGETVCVDGNVEELTQPESVDSNGTSKGDVKLGKAPIEIHRFSPTVDGSGFYLRLKTIAEKSQSEGDLPEEEKE